MKMFKKTLIAASVATLAGTAVAGINDGVTTPTSLALEGTVAAGTVAIGNELTVNLTADADYIANDVLEFYVTGATIDVENSDPSVGALANFIDMDADTGRIRFRVQSEVSENTTLSLTGVDLLTDDLSSGTKINVSSQAVSLNPAIGEYDVNAAKTVAVATPQFKLDTTNTAGFNGVINVEDSRELFVAGASDTASVVYTDQGGVNQIALAEVVHTITGSDFGHFSAWADDEGEIAVASGVSATGVDDTFAYELSEDLTTLTITQTAATGIDTDVDVTLNAPGADSGVALAEQSFTASVVGENAAGVSATIVPADTDFGQWTLNGASVFVPYMPYSSTSALSQIIYVTNNGSQSGQIEVTAFDDAGNDYGPYDLGTVNGKSVKKLTTDLNAKLFADGVTSGKLAFTVTVTAPAGNIEVYTAYKAGNDRGTVINSSN